MCLLHSPDHVIQLVAERVLGAGSDRWHSLSQALGLEACQR